MRVITSFSLAGHGFYGKRFLETYHRHWNLPLVVYSEDELPIPHRRLDDPDHVKFRDRSDATPDYRFQAVRFSHKVFSILDAAKAGGLLVWLDADVVTFRDVPDDFIAGLLPKGKHIAYLGRDWMHSECGFVVYDCDRLGAFFDEWRRLYTSGEIYALKEWHDSYVFDYLREKLKVPSENISGPGKRAHHPFINSPLGKYMDHLKGNRKDSGRSGRSDLVWKRPEGYWRAV